MTFNVKLLRKVLKTSAVVFGLSISLLLGWYQFNAAADRDSMLRRIEYILYDFRFNISLQIRSEKFNNPNHIFIADIDEKSLEKVGRWPWSREIVADFTQKLADAGVILVVYDVLFSEPQINPTEKIQSIITDDGNPELAKALDNYKSETDFDLIFSESMLDLDVILSFLFTASDDVYVGELPSPIMTLDETQTQRLLINHSNGFASNLPLFMDNAIGAGFFVPSVDTDGIIRSVPLMQRYQKNVYPSLALAAGLGYYFADTIDIETTKLNDQFDIVKAVKFIDKRIETAANGEVLIPFQGGQKTFPYVSAVDILRGEIPEGLLENAIVFVGTSSVGIADLRSTPVGTQYPGVEIHASLLNGLIEGSFPYTPDLATKLVALIIVLLGLLLSFIYPRLGPINILLFSGILLAMGLLINFYLWHFKGINFPQTSPLLFVLALGIINWVFGSIVEGLSKKEVQEMFGQYVPKAHIEHMLESAGEYTFEGENKPLTVLFSDIRSFTSISEQLNATELKQLLNNFFTPITEIIFNHNGTIDKYVGDMVMAFWGAPIEDEKHPSHAVNAALKMLEQVEQLKPVFQEQGLPEVNVGIGINTGPMNVGDMGSTFRRAYTVLGDSVNLGSRLESLTKFYGIRLLIGPDTYDACPEFTYRFIDKMQVKGKEEPIECYEPIGLIEEVSLEWQQEIEKYNETYKLYLDRQWQQASDGFLELSQTSERPKLYQVYLARISELRAKEAEGELNENWDGTYRHNEK